MAKLSKVAEAAAADRAGGTPSSGPHQRGKTAAAAGAASPDNGVVITVAGERYVATEPGWREEMALHQQSSGGLTWGVLLGAMDTPGVPPPFILAGFIFLAKAQAGTPEPYQRIVEGLSYESIIKSMAPIAAEPAPEDPGSD